MDRPKLNQIGALRAIAKAAHDFRVNINCYSVGVSLLSEERMKVLDAELQEAFQALVDARAWDKAHPLDPSRLPPSVADQLAASESRNDTCPNCEGHSTLPCVRCGNYDGKEAKG